MRLEVSLLEALEHHDSTGHRRARKVEGVLLALEHPQFLDYL
jgi:hypothetical protein